MNRFIAAGLLALLLIAQPLAVQGQAGGPVYIVEAGDTLSGIARTFGTSVEALLAANGLTNPNQLQPGQQLAIPGFEEVQGVLRTQQVAAGQTLNVLAARQGADPDDLARLNRVLHPGRIYVGQSLILPQPGDAAVDTAATARPYLVPADGGIIQYAASQGQNPWSVALASAEEPHLWWVPGEWAQIPTQPEAAGWLPAPVGAVEVEPEQSEQGETVALRVVSQEPIEIEGRLADWDLGFVQGQGDEMVALQGIHALIEPGLYELEIRWQDPQSELMTGFRQPYPIRSGNYGFDPILIVPEETLGPENTIPEDELINELAAPVTDDRQWDGPFEWPSDHFVESFPSVFGTRRNYNNTGYNAYHTGLDFYGGIGVEILAPAPGEVVLVEDLVVRGLTTMIDHGWGVYSLYMHQSDTTVEVGDRVDTGQLIGLVGASGRVTGAHLHWEIRVGGVPVEPLDWVQNAYP